MNPTDINPEADTVARRLTTVSARIYMFKVVISDTDTVTMIVPYIIRKQFISKKEKM